MGIKPRISFHVELLTEKYEDVIPIMEEIHKRQIDCEIVKTKTYDFPEEYEPMTIELPEVLQRKLETLCKIARCDVKEKVLEILENTIRSAEIIDEGRKVENF
jgi:hypothetical protein